MEILSKDIRPPFQSTFDACLSTCKKIPDCMSITHSNGLCHIKNKKNIGSITVPNINAKSAVVKTSIYFYFHIFYHLNINKCLFREGHLCSQTLLKTQRIQYFAYRKKFFRNSSPDECCERCNHSFHCDAWQYHVFSRICYMTWKQSFALRGSVSSKLLSRKNYSVISYIG